MVNNGADRLAWVVCAVAACVLTVWLIWQAASYIASLVAMAILGMIMVGFGIPPEGTAGL